MAEGAEGDGRVADGRLVGQHDFEDGDVVDDGGGDGGDEQEDGGDEEEDDADPVGEGRVSVVRSYVRGPGRAYQCRGEVRAMASSRSVDIAFRGCVALGMAAVAERRI